MTGITVRRVDWNHPDSEELRGQQRAELEIRYGTPDSEPGVAPSADDITVFFVAYVDEAAAGEAAAGDTGAGGSVAGSVAAGCGGLRQLDDTSGEIKRMFVTPTRRGTGVSVAVLRALEADARERGWTRLQLETGTEQPEAVRFYEREGYTPIPRFGHYVHSELSLCFARDL